MSRQRTRALSPGDSHPLRLRKKDDPKVIEWCNMQDNLTESIIYIIEEYIREHGVYDLSTVIPMKRKPLNESGLGQEKRIKIIQEQELYSSSTEINDSESSEEGNGQTEKSQAIGILNQTEKDVLAEEEKREVPEAKDDQEEQTSQLKEDNNYSEVKEKRKERFKGINTNENSGW